jgi:hypothetical protein
MKELANKKPIKRGCGWWKQLKVLFVSTLEVLAKVRLTTQQINVDLMSEKLKWHRAGLLCMAPSKT